MERVEITVRGEHTSYLPPERATVHAAIGLEGPSAPAVYDGVVDSARRVTSSVQALHDPGQGPITWFSSDQVRTWANRPWNQDGKQLPVIHHARLGWQVKFRDFASLSRWLGEVTLVQGFSVERIEWALTAEHKLEVTREVRRRAVQQALEKAQAYADALDLGPMHPIALADAGCSARASRPRAAPRRSRSRERVAGAATSSSPRRTSRCPRGWTPASPRPRGEPGYWPRD